MSGRLAFSTFWRQVAFSHQCEILIDSADGGLDGPAGPAGRQTQSECRLPEWRRRHSGENR